jgi:hypothetical protein
MMDVCVFEFEGDRFHASKSIIEKIFKLLKLFKALRPDGKLKL